MPSDDYAAVGGGGALKLKGAKVHKKKKKNRDKTDLEKNLAGDGAVAEKDKSPNKQGDKQAGDKAEEEEEKEEVAPAPKTESERRYEEIKRRRLLEMAEASDSRPELLKTHKERVEELNTYLSKLSEHHDMPKIGPG